MVYGVLGVATGLRQDRRMLVQVLYGYRWLKHRSLFIACNEQWKIENLQDPRLRPSLKPHLARLNHTTADSSPKKICNVDAFHQTLSQTTLQSNI